MRILIFGIENWLGIGRYPYELRKVGFEVGTVCPPDVVLSHTRHVNRRFPIVGQDANSVVTTFARALHEWRPVLVIPGDERVLHFLHRVVEADAAGRPIGLDAEAMAVVRRSLPDQRFFQATNNKYEFSAMARSLGVRTPENAEVANVADALQFAEAHRYPVVLKAGVGYGGMGVTTCRDEDELVAAVGSLAKARTGAQGPTARASVERFIAGPVGSIAGVALDGEFLVGHCSDKTVCHPANGPSTIRTFRDLPEVEDFTARVVSHTRFTGFFGVDYIVDGESGLPYIIEMNARPTPAGHLGRLAGWSPMLALYNRLNGLPLPPRQTKPGWVVALYPQEVIRDPDSPYLQTAYHDVPEDDPELMEVYAREIERLQAR